MTITVCDTGVGMEPGECKSMVREKVKSMLRYVMILETNLRVV